MLRGRFRIGAFIKQSVAVWAIAAGALFAVEVQAASQTPATAATPADRHKSVVVRLQGPINGKTLEAVRQALPKVQGDPPPAGLIVLLDSMGGDGVAAMNIGRLLRAGKAHVFVTGQCASACIFVLAAGVIRGAPAYTVGIHRGRLTATDPKTGGTREIDTTRDPNAARTLERFETMASGYLAEMGMPPELFTTMQSHQLKGVFRLNDTELTFYGLSGFDSAYLDERAQTFESLGGAYRMDRTELARREAKVASFCAKFDSKSAEFVSCYLNVLRDPWLN